jgi:outer membrane protein assembly factor BamB
VVTVDGKHQIVCGMPTRIVAYDPEDGQILWSCAGLGSDRGDLVYASPLYDNGLVAVMAGYMGPAVAVRPSGTGDVTLTHRVWHATKHIPQRIGSGVVVDDLIYIGNADGGTIECLDLGTGQQRWRARVRGGPHWASMVHANGLLYATNQSGITRVLRPNPDRLDLVSENALDEQIHATPAFSENEIIIRTAEHLYCIANRDAQQ